MRSRCLHPYRCLCACACVLLAGPPAFPAPASSQETLDRDVKRGWYWYEDPAEQSGSPEESPARATCDAQPPQGGPASGSVPGDPPARLSPEQMMRMHPDEIQAHMMETLKWAVKDPSIDNVAAYMQVQDVVRRKALAFASVTALVSRLNPEMSWDANSSALARTVQHRMRTREIAGTLRSLREEFALVYFFEPGCAYCERQGPSMDRFAREHGWTVRKVQLSLAPDLAARFDIETVPYVILVCRRTGEHIPVGYGLTDLSTLTRRVYEGVRYLTGEISPEQFGLYESETGTSLDPASTRHYRGWE